MSEGSIVLPIDYVRDLWSPLLSSFLVYSVWSVVWRVNEELTLTIRTARKEKGKGEESLSIYVVILQFCPSVGCGFCWSLIQCALLSSEYGVWSVEWRANEELTLRTERKARGREKGLFFHRLLWLNKPLSRLDMLSRRREKARDHAKMRERRVSQP